MIFILDANIWISEKLLRSAVGVAFLHAISRLDTRIILPESTRHEVIAGVESVGAKAVAKVQDGFLTIQSLIGKRPDYDLPSAEHFRSAADTRLSELSDLIEQRSLKPEYFLRALSRVNEHRPPAATREQYRDCLLWEFILETEGECFFVGKDGDFTEKGGKGNHLDPHLSAEVGNRVRYFSSLAETLKMIEPHVPPIDKGVTATAIASAILPAILRLQETQGFRIGERIAENIELYATQHHKTTTAVFELVFRIFELRDHSGNALEEGTMRVNGECLLINENEVSELKLGNISLFSLDGVQMPGGAGYAYIDAVIFGTRQIPYSVRARLP